MKSAILFCLVWLAGIFDLAAAVESVVVNDVTYRDVTLRKDYPRSVFLQHEGGGVVIDKAKLSDEDLKRLGASLPPRSREAASASVGPQAGPPPAKEKFVIEVAGAEVNVTRWGDGPVGVIFFSSSKSEETKDAILSTARWYTGLVPGRCSFFVWTYPKPAPFNQVWAATHGYLRGDEKKLRPDFRGIASSVVAQIREKTGLTEWLLVGNSMGAGVILWDYDVLARDPQTSFLLISPAEPFMPPVSGLGKLERTMLIAAKGWKNGDEQKRPDMFLGGVEAWDWVASNLDVKAVDSLNEASVYEPEKIIRRVGCVKHAVVKRTDFSAGHKMIGEDINNELLAKMIRVKLGMADYGTLAQAPLQKPKPR